MSLTERRARLVLIAEATSGGVRRHLQTILESISRDKFDPILYCSALRDPTFMSDIAEMEKSGITVRLFSMRRGISPVSDIWNLFSIARALRKDLPHIVHTHSSKAGFIGRLAAKFAGIPRVIHSPHVFPFEMRVSWHSRMLYLWLERLAACWTDMLLAVSKSEKKIAARRCGFPEEKIVLIRNGIDCGVWTPAGRRRKEAARRACGIPRTSFTVGLVGRLSPQKGCLIFVDTCMVLLSLSRDLTFVVCGDGPMEKTMRERVRQCGMEKHFLFMRQSQKIQGIYRTLDCLMLPSLWESCPYTALEAMAMGIPVVASNVGGIPEIIKHRASGLISEPSPRKLAKNIIWLKDHPSDALEIIRDARRRVLRKFNLDNSIRSLEKIYLTMSDDRKQTAFDG